MSNPKRPVSTVEEFIKVFHEMSARYGHSELWYDYIDMNFVRMRSVSSTNMTLMLRRSELCCVPTKSVPKNHAHSAVPFSKIKHPAFSGATRKTVVC